MRRAKVYVNSNGVPNLKTVRAYMPSNYKAQLAEINGDTHILIKGEDYAGWTLEDYIIPRLGSGLILAEEISDQDDIACICEGRGGHNNEDCPWFEGGPLGLGE
jgi:hypothetical protein